jgi:hypothetical protein
MRTATVYVERVVIEPHRALVVWRRSAEGIVVSNGLIAIAAGAGQVDIIVLATAINAGVVGFREKAPVRRLALRRERRV